MSRINLNELTLDNLQQWPTLLKASIFLGIVILISVCGYELFIKNHITQYKLLQKQEFILKTDFEKKQHQTVNLSEYHQHLQRMNKRFTSMMKQLLVKKELPVLLEKISKTGIAAGLKFEFFAPQPEVIHDFYIELPIKISVVGSYFQLAAFLSHLAEIEQLITLHEFSIERVSAEQLIMSITAKIYRHGYHE